MTRGTALLAGLSGTLLLVACGGGARATAAGGAATAAGAAGVLVTPCDPPAGTPKDAAASLDVRFVLLPAPADSARTVALRMEGPVGQPNTVQLAPAIAHRLDALAPGVHHLVASLDGYRRRSARVTLAPGCPTGVTITLVARR